jgi:HK97 family phage major capsid protein
MDSYKKLRAENDARYRQMSELIEKANQAGGDLSAEDTKTFDGLDAEYRRVQGVIEKNHQLMALAAKDKETGFVDVGPDAPEMRRAPAARETAQRAPRFGDFRCSDEYVNAYSTYLKRGEHTPVAEMRALSEGTANSGDVLPPTEFHQELAKRLQQMCVMRQLCRVMPLGSWKREIAIETGLVGASFLAEAGSASDSTGTFAARTLQPRRLAGLALVSNELIEDAPARGPGFSIESILTEQFGRKFAETEETGFISGNGTAPNPRGLMSYTGTGQNLIADGKTFAGTAASPTYAIADVIDWVYSLPREYRMHPSTAIVCSDTFLQNLRKLAIISGSTTTYFWQPSGALGEPDRFMGIPVYPSHAVSSAGTTGNPAKLAVIGAFDYAVIGERNGYTLKVLRERYAESNQTGYYAQSRVDFTITNVNAFRYLSTSGT